MHTTAQPHDRRPQEPRRTDIPADPDTLIDVAPAYLAGRSYANQVFERLTGEWAWGHSTATELSWSFAWSPDHRFRLVDGQLDPGAWWHIAAARDPLGPPQWQAGFSKETPPEFVTAVAEELARTGSGIDWTGEGHPALKAPTDRRALIRILQDAGWRSTYRNGELDLEAPDRLARVQIRIDPPGDALDLMSRPHLYVEIGPRDNGRYPTYWQAMATTGTPTAAVDAIALALTDPTPPPALASTPTLSSALSSKSSPKPRRRSERMIRLSPEAVRPRRTRVRRGLLELPDYLLPTGIRTITKKAWTPT
ncbi:DUF317 domain-containing protein [Kitasatospora sp. NPDC092286]|uniref:DUF317 domain-containing protein n=1 Tax=Kitasatospora sp. NPDC092286 TaxID=3364087 RepID=UPI00381D24E4